MSQAQAAKHEPSRNIAVLLTPPGRGAVATVRIEGDGAAAAVGHFLRLPRGRRFEDQPLGRISYGRWGSPEGEDVVACRLSARQVEVHCHGGAAASESILQDLVSQGCTALDWRRWLAASEVDPIKSAATMALAQASTQRAAIVLLDQHGGALRLAVEQVRASIKLGRLEPARSALTELLGRSSLGLHLAEPWQVVLGGPPNVGKSSLINALLGYRRAIVYDMPGTTRDVVTATTAIDGWPVRLSDTAGLRLSEDPLEAAGVERAQQQIRQADLLLLVFDASLPWTAAEEALRQAWPAGVILHNKSDLPPYSDSRPTGLAVSATTGEGLDRLIQLISNSLVPIPPEPGATVPFTPTQVLLLTEALAAINIGETSHASSLLSRMIGQE